MSELDVQVTWEDQQKINTFSRLNIRRHDLEDELKALKSEEEKISFAADEIYLTSDIKFSIGEAFVSVDTDTADTLLSELKAERKKEAKTKMQELETIQERMKHLKAQLYAKFGKAINLEEK